MSSSIQETLVESVDKLGVGCALNAFFVALLASHRNAYWKGDRMQGAFYASGMA